ncbi:MAG TPA: hypothetical protein IGS40_11415 [Trichormus sp. M33_DOE_039]|nr:hypothetical protein [Trichormus sp. M33_DOE_039]
MVRLNSSINSSSSSNA